MERLKSKSFILFAAAVLVLAGVAAAVEFARPTKAENPRLERLRAQVVHLDEADGVGREQPLQPRVLGLRRPRELDGRRHPGQQEHRRREQDETLAFQFFHDEPPLSP